jgi:NTE family protein
MFESWWNYWHSIDPSIASGEASRRYYSVKQFTVSGVPNVFVPLTPSVDGKFWDAQNVRFRYDNTPLKRTVSERFAKFPEH